MKYESIKNNRDFVNIYNKGKRFVNPYLVMYKLRSTGEKRVGITVSKKIGKAVVRNRVRRLIRQAIYLNYPRLKDGYDYVFVARVRANAADYKTIEKNLSFAVSKLG